MSENLYYIHNGSYCGNSMLWWRQNGAGYTTNIKDAGKYTKINADDIHANRKSDVPFLCSVVDNPAVQEIVVSVSKLSKLQENSSH